MGTGSLRQPDWYVSAATGNNRASGLIGAPVRDLEEIGRRYGRGTAGIKQLTTVHVLDSLPSGDALNLNVGVYQGIGYRLEGTATVVDTGTFTGVTAINRATQQFQEVADSGQDFTPHLYRAIRITGGARAGACTSVAKVISATSARTGRWVIPNRSVPQSSTTTSPQVGDPYEIVTFPTVYVGNFEAYAQSAAHDSYVNFHNLDIDCQATAVTNPGSYGTIKTVGAACGITSCTTWTLSLDLTRGYVYGSRLCFPDDGIHKFTALVFNGKQTAFLRASVAHATFSVTNTTVQMDFDMLFQNTRHGITVTASGSLDMGTVAMFDCTQSANLSSFGSVRSVALSDSAGLLWGTNNTGHVRIDSGGRFEYVTLPTLNSGLGLGREVRVGGLNMLWSDVPFVNTSDLARCVTADT